MFVWILAKWSASCRFVGCRLFKATYLVFIKVNLNLLRQNILEITAMKNNMSPEKEQFQKENRLPSINFQGQNATLSETNSSHLKMDGWKISFLLG